jgi:hypothetical protein
VRIMKCEKCNGTGETPDTYRLQVFGKGEFQLYDWWQLTRENVGVKVAGIISGDLGDSRTFTITKNL